VAHFLDTPNGRVGIVSTNTTWAKDFAARPPGRGIAARPGQNPLRWGKSFVLPEAEFKEMQRIEALLGIAEGRREMNRVEVQKDIGPDRFTFGAIFDNPLTFERGASAYMHYSRQGREGHPRQHPRCRQPLRLRPVQPALSRRRRRELVLAPRRLDHRGLLPRGDRRRGEHGRRPRRPHGARDRNLPGRPIFYSLNSLIMEFEAGQQIMSPEMFEGYGHPPDALPSTMPMGRVTDSKGNKIGFYAEKRFSRAAIALCDIADGNVRVALLPIDLDLNRPRPAERGVPRIADAREGQAIADDLARLSTYYGTPIAYTPETGLIAVG
jgi:poly-gamma-glutamate synthesis protein (capsule biosynthesis protein)